MRRAGMLVQPLARVWLAVSLALAILGCGQGGALATFDSPTHSVAVRSAEVATGPSPTAHPRPTTTPWRAAPLPDSMIGAWYLTAPAFMWFVRAGDPWCVTVARTRIDCMGYQVGGQSLAVGAVSMDGNVLRIDWVRGYCTGVRTFFGTAVDATTLKLFDRPDDCGGFDLTLTRAGTGSAPTSPPLPT